MVRKMFALLGMMVWGMGLMAQNAPFDIYLEPTSISGLGGLQAYAWGQANGKWLIVGGRLDGLHRRQPFAAFDVAGNNSQLIVVDPVAQQKWAAPVSSLPLDVQEQLSSTNMEFHQTGDYLYLVGGYGYDNATATRITFPNLTAIHVPAVIDAVIAGTALAGHFRQIADPQFAVTGGHLKMIDSTYYLVCGNQFDGNYNPMGNPTYTQVYTDAVRKFQLQDDGTTLTVAHLPSITDANAFHRRDLNIVPQILPSGAQGITVFSGVFQPTINLPYLNSVDIDSGGYAVNAGFQQYYNHYHCGVLPMYAAAANEMHNVFFGGIAQYYDSAGTLVQDDNVPFVNTIARVTRSAAGVMSEHKLPVTMPSLLGAGAEFIPLPSVPKYANEVLQLDALTADSNLVGYLYGGISSTAPNVFFTNTGTQSSASNTVFKVYVIRNGATGMHDLNEQSLGTLALQVFPNPSAGDLVLKFRLVETGPVHISVRDISGRLLEQHTAVDLRLGENVYRPATQELRRGGTYFVTVETSTERATQKVVIGR